MRKLFKTKLQAAIADLKAKGRISSAKDVLEHLDYKSKGTLSAYATGLTEISEDFKNKFENYYDVKLDDYADLVTDGDNILKAPHHGSAHPELGKEDYQAKYIALLEEHLSIKKALFQKIEGFEQMIEDFKKSHETIAANFTEAAAVIEEVRKAQHVMYALQNAYYQYFLGKAGDKEDAWQTIVEAAAKDLGLIQTKGIQIDLDIIHNGS